MIHDALYLFRFNVQISDNILNVLNTHAQTDEVRGDTGSLLLGLGELLMGGGGRVNHQAFGIADIGQVAE